MFAERGVLELVFLAAVALIVVGPKDLPVLMRRIGQFTAKMRGLAAEFRASFEEMARQSELDELRKEVEALRQGQLATSKHQVEIEQHFDEVSHALSPAPAQAQVEPEPRPEPVVEPLPEPTPDAAPLDLPEPHDIPSEPRPVSPPLHEASA